MTREEIRAQFESGQITWSDALDLLKKAQPPWRTKKWDLRRQEVIGDACGVCGNQDPPLVLQHKWHPAPFSNLCERVKPALRDEYEKTHPFIPPVIRPFDPSTVPPPDMVERDSCPKCASIAVKYRSTLQNWICNGKQRYRTCGHIFLEPVKRMWSRKTRKRLAVPSVQAVPDSSSLLFLARMNHGIIETMARSYRSLAKQWVKAVGLLPAAQP